MISRRRLLKQGASLLGLGPLALPLHAQSVEEGEAQRRKARSMAVLRVEGVPVNTRLPVIITASASRRRPFARVVQRCVALAVVAAKAESGDHAIGQVLTKQFSAIDFFSAQERAFMDDPAPDDDLRDRLIWRYEGAHVMLWALGIHERLGRPTRVINIAQLGVTMRDLGVTGILRDGVLRPQNDLLDAADLAFRYDWAVKDALQEGLPPPSGLNAGVVRERLPALNWLTDPEGRDWDAVTAET